jgi:DNA invertase Pin-like site-specific DNA recombinase
VAVAYLRVSTSIERQELGATWQRQAIERWAVKEGVEIAAWYVEEGSGGLPLDKRPRLLEAIGAVAAHRAGLMVVAKLCRFSREPLTAALAEAELQKLGATVAVVEGGGDGGDATSILIRSILLAVNRFEKEMIRARVRVALQVKKQRGELTGVAPYGYRVGDDGKTLVPDPHEAAVLNEVRALRASGLTIRRVQEQATAKTLLGRTGKPFTIAAIHHMVRQRQATTPAE